MRSPLLLESQFFFNNKDKISFSCWHNLALKDKNFAHREPGGHASSILSVKKGAGSTTSPKQ